MKAQDYDRTINWILCYASTQKLDSYPGIYLKIPNLHTELYHRAPLLSIRPLTKGCSELSRSNKKQTDRQTDMVTLLLNQPNGANSVKMHPSGPHTLKPLPPLKCLQNYLFAAAVISAFYPQTPYCLPCRVWQSPQILPAWSLVNLYRTNQSLSGVSDLMHAF